MRLRAAQIVELGLIANGHAVEFGDVGRIQIHTPSDLYAEQAQHPGQHGRAAQVVEKALHRHRFIHIGYGLAHPHERRPHRIGARFVAPDQQPLHEQDQHHGPCPIQRATDGQVPKQARPVLIGHICDGAIYDGIAHANVVGQRQHDARAFHQCPAHQTHQTRPECTLFIKAQGHFTRRKMDGRRTEPSIARFDAAAFGCA